MPDKGKPKRKPRLERVTRNEEEQARAIRTKPNQVGPKPARGNGDEKAEAQAEADSGSAKTSERIETLRKPKPEERKRKVARWRGFIHLKKGKASRGGTK